MIFIDDAINAINGDAVSNSIPGSNNFFPLSDFHMRDLTLRGRADVARTVGAQMLRIVGTNMSIENCEFLWSRHMGLVVAGGRDVTVRNCRVWRSVADGIAVWDTDNVVIEGNQAGWSGSGLYVEESSAAIFATVIRDNDYAQAGGGGLVVRGGAPTFENLRVSANFAAEEYGVAYGGGAWLEDTRATFTNAAFVQNDTYGAVSSYGGGIYVRSGEPVFTNVLVYDNTTDDAGGGVYVRAGTPRFLYSDVWGNGPDDWYGLIDPTGTDGNLSVDPDLLSGGVHLDASSALIDAGDPTRLDPDGSRSDIGLFGGPSANTFDQDQDGWPGWWLPGPYDATTSPGMDCDDDNASVYPGRGC